MHTILEMSAETYAGCLANGADLSLEGHELRLLAVRTAIRFRHPQTGARLWCHQREYRAVYVGIARRLRRVIRRLRALQQSAQPSGIAGQLGQAATS